ncbi:Uncharacterised protein [Zhongshania aliphaticivorans]|uniref:Uncharacterized protein n=1 Tax=Zhongshania aliphaticivorans TaxID=1470434 RepID=A0A5S9NQV7_9GAMM|nr:DUF6482 family protein [Zhongshania aliphaticivorans]CAA0092848.1 Uncharacterised protein [Zhongshania aliphaticivorans]CAA0110416.1 Uncharacterised protein [Zhongshania aliphaticivorans]
MTKVFTDQLAALPISEVIIRAIEGGMYIAFVALGGRLLKIYEADSKPLCRRTINDIKSVMLENGCGGKAFLIDHSWDDGENAPDLGLKVALA